MAEGTYIRDEKSPSFVPRTSVQQCARSEVPVPRRPAAPLWRVGYVECCGQEQLLCDGGSVVSTVDSPGWCIASAVCKSSMLCCCTAVANSPCMRVSPILQVVDQRVLSARKKKGMTPSLLHERHLWRAMDCKSCLLYTSPSPRDKRQSRMPSSA